MSNNISGLMLPSDYQSGRQHIFQSKSSLDWFFRRHRAELVERGAMLMLTGRWFVNPEAFDLYLLARGAKDAAVHV